MAIPEDLDRVEVRSGAALWAWLAPSYRRNVLRWIKLAKTDATRARRLDRAAEATGAGERIAQM